MSPELDLRAGLEGAFHESHDVGLNFEGSREGELVSKTNFGI